MKNILIAISSLKLGGGAEKVATTVGNKLSEKGYNVSYLTFYNTSTEHSVLGQKICLNESPTDNIFIKFYKFFHRAYHISRICKQYDIDSSISFMEESNFPNILSKLFGNQSRTLVSIRASIEETYGNLYKSLIYILYRFADMVIPVSKEEKDNLIQNYGIKFKNIETIYNGIDTFFVKDKIQEELIPGDVSYKNHFTFITIGRLLEQKNQQLLIRAFHTVHNIHPSTRLLILGEGPLKQDLIDLSASLGINENVIFVGNTNNPYKYLSNSDCFVLSSLFEGFPNVIIEAMACGLPVISTDCKTGPKEILKNEVKNFLAVNTLEHCDYGILTPSGNKETLTKAMMLIYEDEQLRGNYKQKSLERTKDFEIEATIKNWVNVI
ncbi:MAG: glycosyltransferase [Candidatus Gracilibacteria bacterium]|nr:glycosyltransferase [Candidatus Gracilibacteria bacterium]